MKIAVFDDHRLGLIEDDEIFDVSAALPANSGFWPPAFVNTVIADWQTFRPGFEEARRTSVGRPVASVRLLPPNPWPGQIVAAPANYRKHIAEMGALAVTPKGKTAREMGFFLKSVASLTSPARGIVLPKNSSRRFDHESELAVVIGRTARNVARGDAYDHVFGYSCLIDVTMRIDGEHNEERVTRKSFETFTPLGPWIVTKDEVGDPGNLANELFVNGERRQSASTADLIVDIPELIEMVSSVMTLYPGDIIATGTPEGIGPLVAGDVVTIRIEKVGEMTLAVSEAADLSPRPF